MKRSPEVIAGVRSTLNDLESNADALTDWERDFVAGMGDRLDKYGDNAYLTDPQLIRLKEIVEKHGL